jgi:hypothetical protein
MTKQMHPRRYADYDPTVPYVPEPPPPPTAAELALADGLAVIEPDDWEWYAGRFKLRWTETRTEPRPVDAAQFDVDVLAPRFGPLDEAHRLARLWQVDQNLHRVSIIFENDDVESSGMGGEGVGDDAPAERYEVWVHHPEHRVLVEWAVARLGVRHWETVDGETMVEVR